MPKKHQQQPKYRSKVKVKPNPEFFVGRTHFDPYPSTDRLLASAAMENLHSPRAAMEGATLGKKEIITSLSLENQILRLDLRFNQRVRRQKF
jgi:hypothetical protein